MRMFHVERIARRLIFRAIVVGCLLLSSCATMRNRDTIPDYVIREGGKTVVGSGALNAFIFEDIRQDVYFQDFLIYRFRKNNLAEKTFEVDLSGQRFKILLYDTAEFEKYFRSSDYIPTVTVTAGEQNSGKSRFVALSMVDESNQDCLSEKSLWFATATEYLKKLKDDYLAHARS